MLDYLVPDYLVRTIWCGDYLVRGLFGARTIWCKDYLVRGLFGARTIWCRGQFGAGQFGAGLFGVTDNLVPIFTGQKRQFMMENFYLDLHF